MCTAYGMAFEIISLYSFILLTQNLTRTHCLLHNTQVDTTALYITEINGTQVVDHDLTTHAPAHTQASFKALGPVCLSE